MSRIVTNVGVEQLKEGTTTTKVEQLEGVTAIRVEELGGVVATKDDE